MFKNASKHSSSRRVIRAGAAVLTVLLLLFSFTSCAAGPNDMVNTENKEGRVAGFWLGLWHGFISFFTFIISLFTNTVTVYEIHNNGGWYNFGFVLGVLIFFGGGGGVSKTTRRRHRD
jgi:hypothetical protein